MSAALADLDSLQSQLDSASSGNIGPFADPSIYVGALQESGTFTGSPTSIVGESNGGSGWNTFQTLFNDATKVAGMVQGYNVAQNQVNHGMVPTALTTSGTLGGTANISAANSSLAASIGSGLPLFLLLGAVIVVVLLVKK